MMKINDDRLITLQQVSGCEATEKTNRLVIPTNSDLKGEVFVWSHRRASVDSRPSKRTRVVLLSDTEPEQDCEMKKARSKRTRAVLSSDAGDSTRI